MKRLLFLFLLLASPAMAQRIVIITGGTVTANVTDSADFYVTLNQNVTGVTLTSTVTPATGYIVSMKFVQDATGSRTVVFGGNISTACVVNSTANSVTICRWQYTASTNAWTDSAGGAAASLTYQNITTNASTVVRSGSGMLGVIQVNNPGAGWGATLYDNTACSGTKIGTIGSFAALPSSTQNYYVTFSTGLCITTSGSTPGDLSIGFSSSPGTFSYSDITANANTVIKASPGRLQWIQVNNPGSGWTLTIYDNTSCSGTKIGTTASLAGLPSSLLKYQQTTTIGLCITTAGSVPGDITVVSL